MTFDKDYLSRISSTGSERAPIWRSYVSAADTLATIIASGYFNDKILDWAVNAVIGVQGTDGYGLYKVTSVTTNVTVEAYDIPEGSLDLTYGSIFIGDASAKAAELVVKTDTQILVGNGTTAASVALSADVTMTNAGVVTIANDAITTVKIVNDAVTTAKILNANVTLAKLAVGITPSHVARFAGKHAYGGGGTSDAATVAGVVAGDIVVAMIESKTNAGYLDLAVPTTDTITFTFSADPGASTVVSYVVFNAAS